jgi:CRP-like cAMP-binding protein
MFIRQAELFDGLSAGAKHLIENRGMEQTYKAGDLIFREGDEGRFFYMLEDGKVDLFIGKQEEARFLVYYPGEIFGWSALVATHRYLATARCVADSVVTRVPVSTLDEILKDNPLDGQLLYKNLAGILGERLIGTYYQNLPQSQYQAPSYG